MHRLIRVQVGIHGDGPIQWDEHLRVIPFDSMPETLFHRIVKDQFANGNILNTQSNLNVSSIITTDPRS